MFEKRGFGETYSAKNKDGLFFDRLSFTRQSANLALQKCIFDNDKIDVHRSQIMDPVYVMQKNNKLDLLEDTSVYANEWMLIKSHQRAGDLTAKEAKKRYKIPTNRNEHFALLAFVEQSRFAPSLLSKISPEILSLYFTAERKGTHKSEGSIFKSAKTRVMKKGRPENEHTCPFLETVDFLQKNKPELLNAITPEMALSFANKMISEMPYHRAKGIQTPIEKRMKNVDLVGETPNVEYEYAYNEHYNSVRYYHPENHFFEKALSVFEQIPAWKKAADRLALELLYFKREELACQDRAQKAYRASGYNVYDELSDAFKSELSTRIKDVRELKKRFPGFSKRATAVAPSQG